MPQSIRHEQIIFELIIIMQTVSQHLVQKSSSPVGSEAKNPLPTREEKINPDIMGLSCLIDDHTIEDYIKDNTYQTKRRWI